jgi:peroxiredoxin
MMLSVGDRLPEADLFVPSEKGAEKRSVGELFGGRRIVLVGMPGAFTPTCHRSHLPGFIDNRDAILERGVDEIIVLSTNDTHVLRAWAEATGATGRMTFVSDGNVDFIRKAGLDLDRSAAGMGVRARRFAMIVDDGVVTAIAVDDQPGQVIASSAAQILEKLEADVRDTAA